MNAAAHRVEADGAEFLMRITALNSYESTTGERAPHKPLLVLLLLARIAKGQHNDFEYSGIEAHMKVLLRSFGRGTVARPDYPFWYLRNDGVWELSDETLRLPKNKNGELRMKELREQGSGRLPARFYNALGADPTLLTRAAHAVLTKHFPSTLHADILDAVGLSIGTTSKPLTELEFARSVLRGHAHTCAVCGFSAWIGPSAVGVEAALIRWKEAGGDLAASNGIALCATHRRAFETGALSFDSSRTVLVSVRLSGNESSLSWLRSAVGKRGVFPQIEDESSRDANLAWHRQEVFKAPAVV